MCVNFLVRLYVTSLCKMSGKVGDKEVPLFKCDLIVVLIDSLTRNFPRLSPLVYLQGAFCFCFCCFHTFLYRLSYWCSYVVLNC